VQLQMDDVVQNISFKRFLLACILFFLSLNIFQDLFPIRRLQRPLEGSFELKEKEPFTLQKWFDGTFSENAGECLNERFGARNLYVKLNNQVRFSLFNVTKVRDFVVGKNNYFYQQGYINEYNGLNFSGEKAVNDSIALLKQLQDQLKSLGKNVLVVLAPSKARIYPEYLPDHMVTGPTEHCHYVAYVNALKKQGIDFIDFNNWYLRKKKNAKYLIFPQFGVHWSRLEAVYAMDTIIKRFSFITKQPFPEIKINKLVELDTLQQPDDDAIRSMNLFFLPRFKKMAYPEYEVIHKERANQNLLVISDSFWWDIYGNRIPEKTFKNNEFWYYNKEMCGNMYLGKTELKNIDIKRHLLQYNDILIICSESNLNNFGFGFLNMAVREMKREIEPTSREMEEYKTLINGTPEWKKYIILKAEKRKMPLEEMMIQEIRWVFQQLGPRFREPTIDNAVIQIKNDPPRLEQITHDAIKNGENLDSAIKRIATLVIEERKRNQIK